MTPFVVRDFYPRQYIPRVWKVWSNSQGFDSLNSPLSSQQPSPPTSANHVGDQPSTSDNKVKGKKGRVNFHFRLCSGYHLTYLCPNIEEASKLLEDSLIAQQQTSSSCQKSCPKQPLVKEVVEPKPYWANPTLHLESDENTTHVSFVSSNFPSQGGIPSMVPLLILGVCSFDWNSLVESHLPSYVPFHIIF